MLGLFHRAISQSGSAFHEWAFSKKPRVQAERLARGVGCWSQDTNKMVACLKAAPAFQIARFHREYLVTHFKDYSQ